MHATDGLRPPRRTRRGLRARPLFGWCPRRSSPRTRLDFVARLPFLLVAHAELLQGVYFPSYAFFKGMVLRPNVMKSSGVDFTRCDTTQLRWLKAFRSGLRRFFRSQLGRHAILFPGIGRSVVGGADLGVREFEAVPLGTVLMGGNQACDVWARDVAESSLFCRITLENAFGTVHLFGALVHCLYLNIARTHSVAVDKSRFNVHI